MSEKNTSDVEDLSYHYMTVDERITLFGDRNYEKNEKRIRQAVAATAGLVVKQENSLIMALYHEVSIGKTASAKEVLGEDVDYLQSVDSAQDVEAKHYMNIVVYTWEEINQRLGSVTENQEEAAESQGETVAENQEEAAESQGESVTGQEATTTEGQEGTVAENQEEAAENQDATTVESKVEISVTESTENGFVQQLSAGGSVMSGEEAMEVFNLTSTNFYVEEIEGGVRFICLGKGSCLGVSQYGANCLAQQGKDFQEIINYYFHNVTIEKYTGSS
jgi:stage II sporulation protein D